MIRGGNATDDVIEDVEHWIDRPRRENEAVMKLKQAIHHRRCRWGGSREAKDITVDSWPPLSGGRTGFLIYRAGAVRIRECLKHHSKGVGAADEPTRRRRRNGRYHRSVRLRQGYQCPIMEIIGELTPSNDMLQDAISKSRERARERQGIKRYREANRNLRSLMGNSRRGSSRDMGDLMQKKEARQ